MLPLSISCCFFQFHMFLTSANGICIDSKSHGRWWEDCRCWRMLVWGLVRVFLKDGRADAMKNDRKYSSGSDLSHQLSALSPFGIFFDIWHGRKCFFFFLIQANSISLSVSLSMNFCSWERWTTSRSRTLQLDLLRTSADSLSRV